jgi:UDP-N-acetylglucosamine 2-epimerase (non-hydrolysing)
LKKILIVFGTRPEAIKMAPLIHAFKRHSEFEVKVLVTAQHRQMLDQVLSFFEIKADYDLDLMKPNQNLVNLTSSVMIGCQEIYQAFKPDLVCVHGDTTTTFAASLTAFYERIQVAHIEAGLRTFDIYSPYPEELNRQVTSKLARFHFAPTQLSESNLIREGVDKNSILVSGNTVIDSLFHSVKKVAENLSEIQAKIPYQVTSRPFVLITGHRRENFGDGFINICEAIRELSVKYSSFDFVYPVHLNPNVQKPVENILKKLSNVHLIPPQDYIYFIYLMEKSYLILTDSGGVQEEAPSLGKPVLVMRDTTERPEAVAAGTVRLVGSSKQKIIDEVSLLIDSSDEYQKMSLAHNPYGDGKACDRIIEFLKSKL